MHREYIATIIRNGWRTDGGNFNIKVIPLDKRLAIVETLRFVDLIDLPKCYLVAAWRKSDSHTIEYDNKPMYFENVSSKIVTLYNMYRFRKEICSGAQGSV